MHRSSCLLLCALLAAPLVCAPTPAHAATGPQAPAREWTFGSAGEPWTVEVLEQDAGGTTVEFRLNRLQILSDPEGDRVVVQGLEPSSSPGLPELPAWSGVFAVPPDAGLGLDVLESETRTLAGVRPRAAEDWQSDYLESPLPGRTPNAEVYGGGAFPAEPAGYGAPALWHGVRVVPLDLMPFQWRADTGELTVYTRLRVRLDHQGSDRRNLAPAGRPLSPLAREMVLPGLANPERLEEALRLDPLSTHSLGRYLVIVLDEGILYLQPWIDWKRQQGYEVTVVPRSELGSNPSMAVIKQRVSQQYTGEGLDYLLLVGDYDASPQLYNLAANTVQGGNYAESTWGGDIVSDHEYTLLEGDDYFPEILVGRLSVDSHQQLSSLVTKLVAYEKTPPQNGNDNWYRDALVIYDVALAGSRRETKLAVRDMLFESGYADVDTVNNNYYGNDLPPAIVTGYVNQGVGIVNYRGYGHRYQWVGPQFGVTQINNDLTNFNSWPIVTSIVCGGGDFGSFQFDPCFGEAWLRATSGPSPKGAVAFIGPSELDTHTKWNNAIDLGIYQGLLREGIHRIGALMMRGKLELWTQFPNEREEDWSIGGAGNCVPHYFHAYNLLGDPGMEVRTREPLHLVLEAPALLPGGPRQIHVRVTAEQDGTPVPGAHVYFYHPDSQSGRLGLTDASGDAWLDLDELAAGNYLLTVHGTNLYPLQQAVSVTDQPSALALTGLAVSDDQDDLASPGETVGLVLSLLEAGTEGMAGSAQLTLQCGDPRVTLVQDSATLEALGTGAATELGGFSLALDHSLRDGDRIPLDILVDGQWLARRELVASAPRYEVTGLDLLSGETEPGQTPVFELPLSQRGLVAGPEGTVRLHVLDGGVDLLQEQAALPAMAPLASATVGPFELALSPDLITGTVLAFELEYRDATGTEVDRRPWSLTVGTPGPGDPTGPDGAGYLILDSGDEHPLAPVYNWFDISTVGDDLNLRDEQENWENGGIDGHSVLVDLPFMFTYYGQIWATITVNSNGWVAMGDHTDFYSGHNTTMPGAQGPPGQIAVFWTDLLNWSGNEVGDVYTWHDQAAGRFIIQWHNFRPAEGFTSQRFQLVLLDSQVWPTPSGQGEMLMYYNQISPTLGENAVTVGLENYTANGGLQYTFNNQYGPTCEPLTAGLALYVTQAPELESTGLGSPAGRPAGFELGSVAPNPFNPSTRVEYSLGRPGRLEWSLFNLLGQRVAGGQFRQLQAGSHSFRLDGTGLASGVYLLRLEGHLEGGAGFQATRKIALVR